MDYVSHIIEKLEKSRSLALMQVYIFYLQKMISEGLN